MLSRDGIKRIRKGLKIEIVVVKILESELTFDGRFLHFFDHPFTGFTERSSVVVSFESFAQFVVFRKIRFCRLFRNIRPIRCLIKYSLSERHSMSIL